MGEKRKLFLRRISIKEVREIQKKHYHLHYIVVATGKIHQWMQKLMGGRLRRDRIVAEPPNFFLKIFISCSWGFNICIYPQSL